MIAKEIEGSNLKISLKKLRLHCGDYYWTESKGLISNDGYNMIYLIFKKTKPATSIGVSKLKYEIYKSTLTKFGNNVKKS